MWASLRGEHMALLAMLALVILAALAVLGAELRRAKAAPARWGRRAAAGAAVVVAVLGAYATSTDRASGMLESLLGLVGALVGTFGLAAGVCFALRRPAAACVLLVVVLAAPGAFLVAGYGDDDGDMGWSRAHLRIVQGQLVELKRRLNAFQQAKGRYPTNDEGLAAVNGFPARFGFRFYRPTCGRGEPVELEELPTPTGYARPHFWWRSQRGMELYRAWHRGPPACESDLREALGLDLEGPPAGAPFNDVYETEVAVSDRNDMLLFRSAGAVSPWWLPYVYENRRGPSGQAFDGSPADGDSGRRYSIEADQGIYVSSVGGQLYAEELDKQWWQDAPIRTFGAVLIAAAAGLVVRLARAKAKMGIGAATLALAFAGGVFVDGLHHVSGCITIDLFTRRSPEMVSRRKALLEKHRAAGVIGEAAYRRTLGAIKLTATTQPALPPATQAADMPDGDE